MVGWYSLTNLTRSLHDTPGKVGCVDRHHIGSHPSVQVRRQHHDAIAAACAGRAPVVVGDGGDEALAQ